MKNDFLSAITQLAAERNLPRDTVLGAIETALVSAFRKESLAGAQNVSVRIIPSTGEVKVFAQKIVVEEVQDSRGEISLGEAAGIKPDVALGDIVEIEAPNLDAGRIAAQTTKQVVMQRLRAAQSDLVFEEFSARQGDMLSGVIQKVESRQVVLDLGRAEAILPITELVPTERYRPNQRLKVIIVDVQRSTKGPQVIVSRSHKDILRRLFELEVPEIMSGTVAIRSVAREPGVRSKVAVEARQEGIDAVGSCVGLRGIRIQNIVNDLQGEKIDVVQWSKDSVLFIANALSPAQVNKVNVDVEAAAAEVIVPDRQLSLAIGREGQNARLAAKLTGWRIDIKSASEALAEVAERTTRDGEERAGVVTLAEAPPTVAEAPPVAVEAPSAVAEAPSAVAEAPPAPVEEALIPPQKEQQPAPVLETPAPEVEAPGPAIPAGLDLESLLKPDIPEEEVEEEVSEGPVFDIQAWIRSQQPAAEERPVLRFAEDIMPARQGGGRGRRGRRGGRSGDEAARGRGPRGVPQTQEQSSSQGVDEQSSSQGVDEQSNSQGVDGEAK